MSEQILPEFEPWPKIPRLKGLGCIITEKIDGTNAQVYVGEDGLVMAASRTRWITPEADNYGFAAWVKEHEAELRDGLKPGRHYGEWWGQRIGRGYGATTRQFSLFNTLRWSKPESCMPACCSHVPVLYQGEFTSHAVDKVMEDLRANGSRIMPFMDPEGVCVFVPSTRGLFKVTFDPAHKGQKGQDQ